MTSRHGAPLPGEDDMRLTIGATAHGIDVDPGQPLLGDAIGLTGTRCGVAVRQDFAEGVA